MTRRKSTRRSLARIHPTNSWRNACFASGAGGGAVDAAAVPTSVEFQQMPNRRGGGASPRTSHARITPTASVLRLQEPLLGQKQVGQEPHRSQRGAYARRGACGAVAHKVSQQLLHLWPHRKHDVGLGQKPWRVIPSAQAPTMPREVRGGGGFSSCRRRQRAP